MLPARLRSRPRRSSRGAASLGAAVALALALASPAALAIERQHHLGLGPALGVLSVDGKSTTSIGFGGALQYAYGLTDAWNLTAGASSVVVAVDQQQDRPESPKNRPATVDNLGIGASYVIDILRWVPWVGVEGGIYRFAGGTLPSSLFVPGASAGAGLDYQLNRSLALGVTGRQHFVLGKLSTYPSYTTVVLRFEYMWGY